MEEHVAGIRRGRHRACLTVSVVAVARHRAACGRNGRGDDNSAAQRPLHVGERVPALCSLIL